MSMPPNVTLLQELFELHYSVPRLDEIKFTEECPRVHVAVGQMWLLMEGGKVCYVEHTYMQHDGDLPWRICFRAQNATINGVVGFSSFEVASDGPWLAKEAGFIPLFPEVAKDQVWWVGPNVVQVTEVDDVLVLGAEATPRLRRAHFHILHGAPQGGSRLSLDVSEDGVFIGQGVNRVVFLGSLNGISRLTSPKVGDVRMAPGGGRVEVVNKISLPHTEAGYLVHFCDEADGILNLLPDVTSQMFYALPSQFRTKTEVSLADGEISVSHAGTWGTPYIAQQPESIVSFEIGPEVMSASVSVEGEMPGGFSVFDSFDEVRRAGDDDRVEFRRGQKYAFTQEGLVHYRLTGLVNEDDTFVVVGVTEKGSVDRLGLSIEFDPSCLFVVRTIDIECTRDRRSIEPGTVVYVSEQEDLG